LAFSRDITERRKAEKALRESEQNFRELIEKAVEGIIVNDLSGKILLVNNTKCRMMGYSREEFLSHNMTYFFDDIVKENHMERYWQKMEPGGLITFTREESRKDGSTFPAEIELTKIIYGGRPAILTFARDISERKKAEMAIKAERDKAQKYLDVAGVLMMAVNAKEPLR
jgi:PAS domain S-box-containing protein